MLISGTGFSYNPKTTEFMQALLLAYDKHVERTGEHPTHVSLPKATTKEDRHMTQYGLELVIVSTRYGCPLIVIGKPIKEGDNDIKEQGKGQQV